MSKSAPKSLSDIICDRDSAIGELAAKAQRRLGLAEHIRACLAAELAAALSHCSVEADGTLVVRAATPEWAARLRFESDTMLSRCREIYPQTQRVKVRVSHGNG